MYNDTIQQNPIWSKSTKRSGTKHPHIKQNQDNPNKTLIWFKIWTQPTTQTHLKTSKKTRYLQTKILKTRIGNTHKNKTNFMVKSCYLYHINGLNNTGSKHTRSTSINKGLNSGPNTSRFWLLTHSFSAFSFPSDSKQENGVPSDWSSRGFSTRVKKRIKQRRERYLYTQQQIVAIWLSQ